MTDGIGQSKSSGSVKAVVHRSKRTKYSRNGCLECKRMKVKCDESKPVCSRCLKGSKVCNYALVPALKLEIGHHQTPKPVGDNGGTPGDLMQDIDHDMSLKIDEILSKELKELENFVVSPFHESELYSSLNEKSANLIAPYDQLNKPISKNEDLLLTETIYSIPYKAFANFADLSHKCYFDIFYSKFSQILMPIKPLNNDRSQLKDDDLNPIRDILLSHAFKKDYLYYAILASGARLSYKATSLEDDQRYFSIFMKRTSIMLNDFTFLQNYKLDGEAFEIVHQKLEPLLLTILLLTSDNAASMEQTWRGHLRGAKELLSKVFLDKLFPETKVLLFCKCWFTSFEVLAGLGAPYGGTLVTEREFEKLIINGDSSYEIETLKYLKVTDEDGFNCLLGFHHSLLSPLIELINLIRSTKDDTTLEPNAGILSLLARFHNNYNGLRFNDRWKKTSHICYKEAALLTILSTFLDVPATNGVVSDLVKSILLSLHDTLLLDKIDIPHFELLLLHWPILVVGLNCVKEEDKLHVEQLLKVLESLGSGSAKHAFDKIKKKWNNEQSSDEVDIVTY